MAEAITLLLFTCVLIGCILADASILIALFLGLLLFLGYGLFRHHTLSSLLQMAFDGVKGAGNILLTFLVIGMLTAVWRLSGTIPAIIYYSIALIRPSIFLPLVFVLNAVVSILIGTSFGTAATMGVICMAMGKAMGMSPVLVGGAMLSGAFYGDRCSPVSTSAMLVSELTKTDLYRNIKAMYRTAVVPTILTLLLYFLLGMNHGEAQTDTSIRSLFSSRFHISVVVLLPAVLILILGFLHVKVRKAMLLSILVAVCCALFLQHAQVPEILRACVFGFQPEDAELARLLQGGGILSMVRTMLIVGISSSYAGIFRGTGLLDGMREKVSAVSKSATPFGATLLVSVFTSMIACNQTLATMLTHQLCHTLVPDEETFALYLENSVITVSALIPWSIACAVPLTTVEAPLTAAAAAFYLYLLPVWYFLALRAGDKAA
ncbi:MAG: sodium:proton antiporter [Lachnospiraceae bacterium]|nr:sodium:proton antiporter [Lachnospiraceae bacterium]